MQAFKLTYTTKDTANLLWRAIRAEVAARQGNFQDTPHLREVVQKVATWLTTQQSTFGLFISGDKGNGKTTLLYALQNLYNYHEQNTPKQEDHRPTRGFIIISAKEMLRLARAYSNPNKTNKADLAKYQQIRDIQILGIDDLGIEPKESVNYGDYVTAAIDLLHHRYQHRLTTLATSNLAANEIASYYDERIADRLREMMLTIKYSKQPSYRQKEINNTP